MRPPWIILIERMSRRRSEEQGIPFEEAFQDEMRAHEERRATQMAGYTGDGSPASVMRWRQLRRREEQLAQGPGV